MHPKSAIYVTRQTDHFEPNLRCNLGVDSTQYRTSDNGSFYKIISKDKIWDNHCQCKLQGKLNEILFWSRLSHKFVGQLAK